MNVHCVLLLRWSTRRHVKKERMKEKADEVRAFKLKQQQAMLLRKQEEDDVAALMLEIEKNKQDELRARMERERVKEELRRLDSVSLRTISWFNSLQGWHCVVGRSTQARVNRTGKTKGNAAPEGASHTA